MSGKPIPEAVDEGAEADAREVPLQPEGDGRETPVNTGPSSTESKQAAADEPSDEDVVVVEGDKADTEPEAADDDIVEIDNDDSGTVDDESFPDVDLDDPEIASEGEVFADVDLNDIEITTGDESERETDPEFGIGSGEGIDDDSTLVLTSDTDDPGTITLESGESSEGSGEITSDGSDEFRIAGDDDNSGLDVFDSGSGAINFGTDDGFVLDDGNLEMTEEESEPESSGDEDSGLTGSSDGDGFGVESGSDDGTSFGEDDNTGAIEFGAGSDDSALDPSGDDGDSFGEVDNVGDIEINGGDDEVNRKAEGEEERSEGEDSSERIDFEPEPTPEGARELAADREPADPIGLIMQQEPTTSIFDSIDIFTGEDESDRSSGRESEDEESDVDDRDETDDIW